MKEIKITINNQVVDCFENDSIMDAAKRADIYIPGICYCSDLKPETSCRLCLVRIKGVKDLQTSCDAKAENGMEIVTSDEEIERLRKINLELILSKHSKNCGNCRRLKDCKIIKAVKDCGVANKENVREKKDLVEMPPAMTFDPNKCINCNNCVQICSNQGVGCLEMKHEDGFSSIAFNDKDCVYCGQCLTHCPSGAFKEIDSLEAVERLLKDKKKHVIFQFSSTMMKSVGGDDLIFWNKESIEIISNFLISQGAEMVFDTSFGIDMIIEKEAEELIEGIDHNRCVFTSHCPSWVRYIKSYYSEFIVNLSRVKSPHIVFGGAVKKYLSVKNNWEENDIKVVSIAPCIAKKYEIGLKENVGLVDHIITINEFLAFLRKKNFSLNGDYNGKGRVFIKDSHSYNSNEEIIMTGLSFFINKLKISNINEVEFKKIQGIKGAIQTSIKFNGKELKLAIVYGLEGAKMLLEELRNNPLKYQYIEVMACPGGCLRGGGQVSESIDCAYSNNIFSNFYEDKTLKINSLFIKDIINNAENYPKLFKNIGNE